MPSPPNQQVNILVTGGAGFIGTHLVRALCQHGYCVVVYDNLLPQVHGQEPDLPSLPDKAKLVVGDVRDRQALSEVVLEADVIYHLAALTGVGQSMYEISNYTDVNCVGTANLLQCLIDCQRPIKRLILASSRAVYGEGKYYCQQHDRFCFPVPRSLSAMSSDQWELKCPECGGLMEFTPTDEASLPQPSSVYAISKLAQEHLCLNVGRAHNISTIVLRYFNVYGPGQPLLNPYTGILSIFSSLILNGGDLEIYEDGCQSRDFVSVYDVVQANLLALETDAAFRIYNVGTGIPTSVSDLARLLVELYGTNTSCMVTGKYRVGDIRHCVADIRRIQHELGYEPKVPLKEGVSEFISWVEQQPKQQSRYVLSKAELVDHRLLR